MSVLMSSCVGGCVHWLDCVTVRAVNGRVGAATAAALCESVFVKGLIKLAECL